MIPEYLSLKIPRSQSPRVVIVGGGFAGLEMAKALRRAPAQVILLDRNNYHTFQPLLYQVATAGLEPDSIAGPLRKVFDGYDDFYFRMVKVEEVDHSNQTIITPIGDLHYDYLVLACGSKTNFYGLESVRNTAFPLKQVVHALNLRSHILQNFEKAVLTIKEADRKGLMNLVVVGGGPTGVEVAGALGELKKHVLPRDFPDLNFEAMQVHLLEGTDRLLGAMSEYSGSKAMKYLEKLDVNVKLNRFVTDYDGHTVFMDDNSSIRSETLIWAAGVQGNTVDGIPTDQIDAGRFEVNEFNQVKGFPNIFAIGDIAIMKDLKNPKGHPMVAQVAMQQGRLLGRNLIKLIKGKQLVPFEYSDKGSMATIGRNKAVVDLPKGVRFSGLSAWLVWMFIHLISLIGFRNKLVTFTNWVWSYFTYDKGNRLIIRRFDNKRTSPAEAN